VELGAVGVSISVFNMISKVFNLPLLNITTSLVAEDASIKEIFPDLPLEPNSPVLDGLLSSEGESYFSQKYFPKFNQVGSGHMPRPNACFVFYSFGRKWEAL
jgi:hypothetical protein